MVIRSPWLLLPEVLLILHSRKRVFSNTTADVPTAALVILPLTDATERRHPVGSACDDASLELLQREVGSTGQRHAQTEFLGS